MNENELVTKAAGTVGALTFLSRILGLVRDILIANFFGSGLSADAFFVAFRIPNLLRRLFAEGSFSVAFIPVFTEYLQKKSRQQAIELAQVVLTVMIFILTIVTVLGIVLSPIIVRIIAPGFGSTGEKFALTVLLTRIMFPYIFLVSLLALFMGILNSIKHFAAPALAPVFLNLGMIAALLFLAPWMKTPTVGLAIGVLVGGVVQLAVQIPFLVNRGIRVGLKWQPNHPALKRIGALMLPTILGSAIYQINQLIGTLLASLLREGSVSYLYYADRLVQFPLGVFAIAISTAVLPSLSREAAHGDTEGLKRTLSHALRLTMFITIPAMIGLIVLREPIIRLLFQRGAFDATATVMTARALLYYSIGLWAFAGLRVFVSAFYSLQDTKTPVKVAVVAMLLNIVFSILLMNTPLEHGGLALALSLASSLQLLMLVFLLRKRLGSLEGRSVLISMARSFLASLVMAALISVLAYKVFATAFTGGTFDLTIGILSVVCAGLVIFFISAKVLRCQELSELRVLMPKTGEKSNSGEDKQDLA
ncbi:MAG: murein biosynthesis integral membrane protein MurJ [Deltaproteobacteria bacterium]|nr:MAG: murein biosynthesis integral membrane protein MurJ [Deltaproteobacteria bacterium]